MPGGRPDDISVAYDEATSNSDLTLLIIHAGTNDVRDTTWEELVEKYSQMIHQYMSKTNKIILSDIHPRSSVPKTFYNRAFSTNNCLKSLCTEEDIDVINCWNDFYNRPFLFKDSIQLELLVLAGY